MDNFDLKKYLAEGRLLKEEDDGYDKASQELFGMTWDEVRKRDDPRMRQDVHDEVQKDDEKGWEDEVDESVNEAGVLDRYRSGETPSREQFNRLHTNNQLARLIDYKKKRLTPDEFKTLTDSLGIKLVDNPLPLTDRDEAPDPWMKDDVARGTRYKKSYIKVYDDKYKEIDKENDEKIFSWIKNLDDYEIERKLKELK